MCNRCYVDMTPDPSRDTTGLVDGSGNPFILFPNVGTKNCILRVNHIEINYPYYVDLVGSNLHCRQGVLNVFIQDTCGVTDNTGVLFRECTLELTETEGVGLTHCEYKCTPAFTCRSTYVGFSKATHITTDYGSWSLNSIDIRLGWVTHAKVC